MNPSSFRFHHVVYDILPKEVAPLFDVLLEEDNAFLTGSRKMGYQSLSSDWDFIIAPCVLDDTKALLRSNGFLLEDNNYTGNYFTDSVWQHQNQKVHLILIRPELQPHFMEANNQCVDFCQAARAGDIALTKEQRKAVFSHFLVEAVKKNPLQA